MMKCMTRSKISDAAQPRQGKRPLEVVVEMLKEQHGTPTRDAYAWADEQLQRMGWAVNKQ